LSNITTIDTNNYAQMAAVMGITSEARNSDKPRSTLSRLRISHTPIMGTEQIKGKKVNVEVVTAGNFKIENPENDSIVYCESIKIRPYMQRFMYKRFVKGSGDVKNMFVKTVMGDSLNIDLKDNLGGFNCGKPAGYIQDFKSLSEDLQNLIRQIKRVRVIFGTVTAKGTDESGNQHEIKDLPFIWEVDNRDAFKNLGVPFQKLFQSKRLPVQHTIKADTEERKLPNGSSFYVPTVSLDLSKTLEIKEEEQDRFSDFVLWIKNYNEYISSEWNLKAKASDEEVATVESFVDIEDEGASA